jgi:dihydroxyacetone kinase-like predicted kinase
VAILYCDAKRFKQTITAGADWVLKNRDQLNKINVFPVPDGDTGTNMSVTLMAAIREMEALKEMSLETTVKAAAWGALMGARGNSGIILKESRAVNVYLHKTLPLPFPAQRRRPIKQSYTRQRVRF